MLFLIVCFFTLRNSDERGQKVVPGPFQRPFSPPRKLINLDAAVRFWTAALYTDRSPLARKPSQVAALLGVCCESFPIFHATVPIAARFSSSVRPPQSSSSAAVGGASTERNRLDFINMYFAGLKVSLME